MAEFEEVKKGMKHLQENNQLSDTICRVGTKGNSKDFLVVGALFAVQSPVFRAELFGSMMESKPSMSVDTSTGPSTNKKFVRIKDIAPQTFQYLLHLFYGLEPKLDFEILAGVAYGTKCFGVAALYFSFTLGDSH